jgi:hypothetical protein
VYTLESILKIIFYGIIKEKYTLVDGNHIRMDRVKNLEKVYNIIQKNICIVDNLIMVKEMVKEF